MLGLGVVVVVVVGSVVVVVVVVVVADVVDCCGESDEAAEESVRGLGMERLEHALTVVGCFKKQASTRVNEQTLKSSVHLRLSKDMMYRISV